MFLTPIDYNKQIENKIASRISEWIYDNIFAGIFDILKISNIPAKILSYIHSEIRLAILFSICLL